MIKHSWNMISPLNPSLDEQCEQQNATDFTCDKIFNLSYISPSCTSVFKDRVEHNVIKEEFYPTTWDVPHIGWFLAPGFYETVSNVWVEIPFGKAGWIVQRSSLNRNGIMVMGSLYDSGYNGTINSTIYVMNPAGVFIEQGARIGQFILADAETRKMYDGQYQSEKRSEDAKKNE